MFCKKCGKELEDGAVVCVGCGFKVGAGNAYCARCGEPTEEGQYMCIKCGFLLGEEPPVEKFEEETPTEEPAETCNTETLTDDENYKKYVEKYKKVKINHIIAVACSLLFALTVIFLPIFRMTYKTESETEFSDWYGSWIQISEGRELTLEDYLSDKVTSYKVDEDGKPLGDDLDWADVFNGNFKTVYQYEDYYSVFDEVLLTVKGVINLNMDGGDIGIGQQVVIFAIIFNMFALIAIIMAITSIVRSVRQLIESLREYRDIEKATQKRYIELRKCNHYNLHVSFSMKQPAVISIIIMLCLHILVEKVLLNVLPIGELTFPRCVMYFGGITFWAIIVGVLMVGHIVFDRIRHSINLKMMEDVLVDVQ